MMRCMGLFALTLQYMTLGCYIFEWTLWRRPTVLHLLKKNTVFSCNVSHWHMSGRLCFQGADITRWLIRAEKAQKYYLHECKMKPWSDVMDMFHTVLFSWPVTSQDVHTSTVRLALVTWSVRSKSKGTWGKQVAPQLSLLHMSVFTSSSLQF